MAHRLAGLVGQKVLLRDIGDVFGLGILGEQMIERLVLRGRISSGIAWYQSSVFAKIGSTSKMTPRNGKKRWRTIWPTPYFACPILVMPATFAFREATGKFYQPGGGRVEAGLPAKHPPSGLLP